jgi:alpha-L-rhamnosidase
VGTEPYRSIRGEIVSNWSRTRETIEWQVTVPANATATIVLPADGLDQIEEGRATLVPARRAEGVRDARMAGNTAAFTVGSGAYRFVRRVRTKQGP